MSIQRILARTKQRKTDGLIPDYSRNRKEAKTQKRIPLPCRFEGEQGGPKGYHLCENETEPLGMWVCKCKGCGPRCPGYEPKKM